MPEHFDHDLAAGRIADVRDLTNRFSESPALRMVLLLLFVEAVETRRDIARLENRILQLPKEIVMKLTDDPNYQQLLATVQQVKGVADSTQTALNNLGAYIESLLSSGDNGGPDTSALKDLAVELQGDNQEILDAITKNPMPTGGTGATGPSGAAASAKA